ncbi:MAG: thermonuclease family protein [Alphaproteobacteria bacterium]|nr:thermonuclease family protein [Alphaproteobacteria bacterium]
MVRLHFAVLGGFIFLTGSALASILVQGAAVVISGDLLTIRGTPFYLRDVDSFELGQTCWMEKRDVGDCGAKAKESLQLLVAGTLVTCIAPNGTKYGGVIAMCMTDKGVDIGEEMVRRGWALVRPDLAGGDAKKLCEIEAEAKKFQRGVWKYRFALPYLYRGEGGKSAQDVSCGSHPRFP